jgi:hypothetical protein
MSTIRITNVQNYRQEIINGELVLTPKPTSQSQPKPTSQPTSQPKIPQLLQNANEGPRKNQVIEINQLFLNTFDRPLRDCELNQLLYASRKDWKNVCANIFENAGIWVDRTIITDTL